MRSALVYTLLIAICCLAVVRDAHAECCITVDDLVFTVDRGTCSSVGGYGGSTCEVRICADGVAQVGSFCGRGPCNMFGCNCDYGCLTGDWTKDFVEKNKEFGVRIIQSNRFP
ncbi:hypothetical protein KR054_010520 [Drosophila jambulina]|nr:hypothetical protein KR054_010520 [Drosophila jambulina]